MSQSNHQLPPKIAQLLKEKGWKYPFDEETKKKMRESFAQVAGSMNTPTDVLKEVRQEDFPDRFPEEE